VPMRAFPADISLLRRLRTLVRADLAGAGVGGEAIDDVVTCVHEACMNAMQHGSGQLSVHWELVPGEVVVKVCDEGEGMPLPSGEAVPDTEQLSGRGLFLIRSLSRRFEASVDDGSRCLAFSVDLSRGRQAMRGSAGFAVAN
jgi:anti-sigma regulatory factor (Ser/Thr protein kinase)